ncbi:MAG: hypothetical protein N4A61_05685 [Pelagimonas sp.]|jgi:uncharacterized lipoprotein YajG|nr:hypothetical protein [Pelagimonas sp.]
MMRTLVALVAISSLAACAAPPISDLSAPTHPASTSVETQPAETEPVAIPEKAPTPVEHGLRTSVSSILKRNANPVACAPKDDGIGGTGCPDRVAQKPDHAEPRP